ncbi:MAG: hypothetical protein QOE05_2169 [Actinomycetota bacterium]|jgi:hypothetical protein|nr:hypothetical protein [Actinomycetota bacterium]
MMAAAPSGTAGPLALLLVLLVGVATVLLIRNMSARLRRLPPSFDEPDNQEQLRKDGDDGSPPSP